MVFLVHFQAAAVYWQWFVVWNRLQSPALGKLRADVQRWGGSTSLEQLGLAGKDGSGR